MGRARCPAHPQLALRQDVVRTADWFWGLDGTFTYGACPECGSWVLDPRPEPGEIGRYYARTYSERKLAAKAHAFRRFPLRRALPLDWLRARDCVHRLRRCGAALDASSRVLDAGAGLGGFLRCLRDLTGAQVRGCDTHPACRAFAAEVYGVEIDHGEVGAHRYPEASFELVSSWHCLEHTYDPEAELRELARVTRPGGWLVLEVPTAGCLARVFRGRWLYLQAPTHLYHLRPSALRAVVERAGFTVVQLRRPWLPSELAGSLLLAGGVKGFAPRLLWPEPGERDRWLRLLGLLLLALDVPVTLALAAAGAGGTLQVVARRRTGAAK